eukprot:CFRG5547T1
MNAGAGALTRSLVAASASATADGGRDDDANDISNGGWGSGAGSRGRHANHASNRNDDEEDDTDVLRNSISNKKEHRDEAGVVGNQATDMYGNHDGDLNDGDDGNTELCMATMTAISTMATMEILSS